MRPPTSLALLLPLATTTATLVLAPPTGVSHRWSEAAAALELDPSLIELVAQIALAVLGLVVIGPWIVAWRRAEGERPRLIALAIGVPIAYAASEGLKLVFTELRPCQVLREVESCPPMGDWSFPSNHTTVAFALFFVALSITRHWPTWIAALLAIVVAGGRVLELAHYPHDVAAGASLGMIVVAATSWVLHLYMGTSRRLSREQGEISDRPHGEER